MYIILLNKQKKDCRQGPDRLYPLRALIIYIPAIASIYISVKKESPHRQLSPAAETLPGKVPATEHKHSLLHRKVIHFSICKVLNEEIHKNRHCIYTGKKILAPATIKIAPLYLFYNKTVDKFALKHVPQIHETESKR